MEFILQEKASYAFYGRVSKNYKKFVEPLKKYNLYDHYVSDLEHEVATQNAICKFLSEQIRQHIPTLSEVKHNFNNSVRLLHKQDLDAVEFVQKFKNREDKLKTYVKLHYALNDIDNGNYELDIASILMAIYLKVVSFERDKNNKLSYCGAIVKVPALKDSLIFKYLDSARKELDYHTTINQLSSYKIGDLTNMLYKLIAVFDFNVDNTVIDESLGHFEDGSTTTIFNEVTIIDPEDDHDTYEKFIELVENNFNKKLIEEMHTLDNGQVF